MPRSAVSPDIKQHAKARKIDSVVQQAKLVARTDPRLFLELLTSSGRGQPTTR